MKKTLTVMAMVIALAMSSMAAMSMPGGGGNGATHYTWDDGVGDYGGPAAAVVNNAGAIVWWQVPGTDTPEYKDVYKLKPFEDSVPYLVADLNEPVRTLIETHFPGVETIYYTREANSPAPSFPNGMVIEDVTDVDAAELAVE